jgi:hypothetical protein
VLKNRASRRDPALCGYCKCSHILEYAALSKTPHALDDLMLVFQHPAKHHIGIFEKLFSRTINRNPYRPDAAALELLRSLGSTGRGGYGTGIGILIQAETGSRHAVHP